MIDLPLGKGAADRFGDGSGSVETGDDDGYFFTLFGWRPCLRSTSPAVQSWRPGPAKNERSRELPGDGVAPEVGSPAVLKGEMDQSSFAGERQVRP